MKNSKSNNFSKSKYKKRQADNSTTKIVLLSILFGAVLAAFLVALIFILRSSGNPTRINAPSSKSYATDNYKAYNAELYPCLQSAYSIYKTNFDKADYNKDGKVSYTDGWLGIQTDYYDAQISCYQIHKADGNDKIIADLQQKRQQDVDTYNAWLASQRPIYNQQPVYNQPRTPVTCTTYPNLLGQLETNCY